MQKGKRGRAVLRQVGAPVQPGVRDRACICAVEIECTAVEVGDR